MSTALEFSVPCIPPKVTAQSSKKLGMINGHAAMFTSAKGKNAEATLAALLTPHRPAKPLEGPLALTVTYTYPWRAGDSQKVRKGGYLWLDKRPDSSNLIKSIEDVMTSLGFWKDDSQIASQTMRKMLGDRPGIQISIEQLT